jgi:hypothetical protein
MRYIPNDIGDGGTQVIGDGGTEVIGDGGSAFIYIPMN